MLGLAATLASTVAWAGDTIEATRRLAAELDAEGRHEAAAIEYRRLALATGDAERRAGYYWAAAYEYWRQGAYDLTGRMLDRAEDASQAILPHVLLLRAEAALAAHRLEEAGFHLSGLDEYFPDGEARDLVVRRRAELNVIQGNPEGARELLTGDPAALQALDDYQSGRDKSPVVSGLLGMLPGLGFAYCGEYDNALRSLLLNALFIYAMADTAADEQWGAFAAVSFFELTWYTGSIYGGIDAAHRYNRQRLDTCRDTVAGDAGVSANLRQIPVLVLRFHL